MEALCTMQQCSPVRTSDVSSPVTFVYTVGVGDCDFETTNMEDELQFSPKNASIVLPQWRSSSAGFTFTSPPSRPPAQPVTLHFLFGGSFIHCWVWPKTSCHNCCYLRAIGGADGQASTGLLSFPTGSGLMRPHRQSPCPGLTAH